MPRPPGSGVLKTIDPASQQAVAIRNRLHAGGEAVCDKHAHLFMRWRYLTDCVKRLRASSDKVPLKRLKQLESLSDQKWRELGTALGELSDAKFSEMSAHLAKAARITAQSAVFGWQWEALRQVEIAILLEGEEDKVASLAGSTANITSRQLYDWLRAKHYSMTTHDVRRFVRDTLKVTLRPEPGKRHDLKQ